MPFGCAKVRDFHPRLLAVRSWNMLMPRVLIVDDQSDVRAMICIVLRVNHFEIVEAGSAAAAPELSNVACLQKPFRPIELMRAAEAVLGSVRPSPDCKTEVADDAVL